MSVGVGGIVWSVAASVSDAADTDAPAGFARCPVHGELVAHMPGAVLGLCSGCASEAAVGLVRLRALANRRGGRRV